MPDSSPAGQYHPLPPEGTDRPTPPSVPAQPTASPTPQAAPPAPNPELDRLLVEIHIRLRQELYEEVKPRLARAKAIAPEHPAVLEAEGDLAFAQRRFVQAQQLYKAAFDADRSNARLEEKFATALVKVHAPDYASHQVPDDVDSLWSFHVRRPAWASGLLSALFPGLGQFYNGDWLKGVIILFIQIGIASSVIHHALNLADIMAKQFGVTDAQGQFILTADHYGEFTSRLLHSFSIPMILLLTALWVYSIVDAIMTARTIAAEGN